LFDGGEGSFRKTYADTLHAFLVRHDPHSARSFHKPTPKEQSV